MGSLAGHLLPGSFFLCFGFWWTYALFERYFKVLVDSTLSKTPKQFNCSASYSKIEGFIKIISAIIGITCEFVTALDKNYRFVNMGIVDLLVYYGYPLPNGSDYMSLLMAAMVEALLFTFHLHGRFEKVGFILYPPFSSGPPEEISVNSYKQQLLFK
ncbi:unnamed protein product [Medioppia subpectinata]|uniref:Uncharacterized protein n=1 Tax=Medioppia subpectinata TaxID=1979941 RepID=A0A7R9L2J6_9ACAR|nr:unnamed protein product [Medioppia subpectinata]CAG2114123.1 unnamed protein product [Medioppia subpectinata]